MQQTRVLPLITDVMAGQAIFRNDMPVWHGFFGDDIWPLVEPSSPLFSGHVASSIVWHAYIVDDKAKWNSISQSSRRKYKYCLTQEIVADLKIAAVIHGYFPKLIKHSRSTKSHLDPKTVKGRINELARFFSLVIIEGRRRFGLNILGLEQIPFSLLKQVIPIYPGRSSHLKRALKLVSDPMVQKNLSAPLQWGLLDITKASIAWTTPKSAKGIPPLLDAQFLFLLDYCKCAIARFKRTLGLEVYDSDCRAVPLEDEAQYATYRLAVEAYYTDRVEEEDSWNPEEKFGITASEITDFIRDAHTSAIMLTLLFTGMRSSETLFLQQDCLTSGYGYWFLKSKVVKKRPKDTPVSEGWLAIALTRDAYDVLMYFCKQTENSYLFSTPFPGFKKGNIGYKGGTLNIKLSRWINRIDTNKLFTNWSFSIHQCRETLVFQLAKQNVGIPFISMQLKHFHSQFNSMPNEVTAGYGQYRSQLIQSVVNRTAEANESALMDVYGENANFAGGGGAAHKIRIDTFFSGLGLFGEDRKQYIKAMARRGVKLMPTSIGNCTKNFLTATEDSPPPCYGDYQCDPTCHSHVITERGANALIARRQHAIVEAKEENNKEYKVIWLELAEKLESHINKLEIREH
ncbi:MULTISPECIES: site-specific integrase [Chromobacterium]|uniref:site-specific integrase n=1 Tax=Chromobacterium TaxID=535 RepID=UPI001888083F|nr:MULTISPECIES: site-specific integrase [Chromobacterium]QOZ83034.1 site-specific integrase [Chromobacterium sp. Rain0013]WON83118.1 site-specific integrase [Chromobacterium haemolyticum]